MRVFQVCALTGDIVCLVIVFPFVSLTVIFRAVDDGILSDDRDRILRSIPACDWLICSLMGFL